MNATCGDRHAICYQKIMLDGIGREAPLILMAAALVGCSHGTFEDDRAYERVRSACEGDAEECVDHLTLLQVGDATLTEAGVTREGTYFLHGQTGDVHTEWSDREPSLLLFERVTDDELLELTTVEETEQSSDKRWLRVPLE